MMSNDKELAKAGRNHVKEILSHASELFAILDLLTTAQKKKEDDRATRQDEVNCLRYIHSYIHICMHVYV